AQQIRGNTGRAGGARPLVRPAPGNASNRSGGPTEKLFQKLPRTRAGPAVEPAFTDEPPDRPITESPTERLWIMAAALVASPKRERCIAAKEVVMMRLLMSMALLATGLAASGTTRAQLGPAVAAKPDLVIAEVDVHADTARVLVRNKGNAKAGP